MKLCDQLSCVCKKAILVLTSMEQPDMGINMAKTQPTHVIYYQKKHCYRVFS